MKRTTTILLAALLASPVWADAVDDAIKDREAKITAADKATVARLEAIARGAKLKKDAALEAKAWAEVVAIVPDHAEAAKALAGDEGTTTATTKPSAKADNAMPITQADLDNLKRLAAAARDDRGSHNERFAIWRELNAKLAEGAADLDELTYSKRVRAYYATNEALGSRVAGGGFIELCHADFCAKSKSDADFVRRFLLGRDLKRDAASLSIDYALRKCVVSYFAEKPERFSTTASKTKFLAYLSEKLDPGFSRIISDHADDIKTAQ